MLIKLSAVALFVASTAVAFPSWGNTDNLAPVISSSNADVVPDSYIVVFKDGVRANDHSAWAASLHKRDLTANGIWDNIASGVKHVYDMGSFQGLAGRFRPDVLDEIRKHPDVSFLLLPFCESVYDWEQVPSIFVYGAGPYLAGCRMASFSSGWLGSVESRGLFVDNVIAQGRKWRNTVPTRRPFSFSLPYTPGVFFFRCFATFQSFITLIVPRKKTRRWSILNDAHQSSTINHYIKYQTGRTMRSRTGKARIVLAPAFWWWPGRKWREKGRDRIESWPEMTKGK